MLKICILLLEFSVRLSILCLLVISSFLNWWLQLTSMNYSTACLSCPDSVLCLVAQSCLTLCYPKDCSPPGSSVHRDSPGKNDEMGSLSLLQGIFPTQKSNPGLLHYRQILYHLSHQGSLYRILLKTTSCSTDGMLTSIFCLVWNVSFSL